MSHPSKGDTGLARLQLILDKMPKALDCQSFEGMTPLHLAFQLRRFSAAKYLISRGANQALRDKQGRNVLHHLLAPDAVPLPPPMFEAMWNLLDPGLAQTLATERMRGPTDTDFPLFFTPLAYSLSNENTNPDLSKRTRATALLRTILTKSHGAGLRVMDGAGNYPIHAAVKKPDPGLARVLLEFDAQMMSWENATGKTALDVLDRECERGTLEFARRVSKEISGRDVTYAVRNGGYGRGDNGGGVDEKVKFWQEMRGKERSKRRLASVFEANQLVRTLDVYRESRARKAAEAARREEAAEAEAEGREATEGEEKVEFALRELGGFLSEVVGMESWEVEEFEGGE